MQVTSKTSPIRLATCDLSRSRLRATHVGLDIHWRSQTSRQSAKLIKTQDCNVQVVAKAQARIEALQFELQSVQDVQAGILKNLNRICTCSFFRNDSQSQAESAREIKEVVKELREKLAATKALKTVVVFLRF